MRSYRFLLSRRWGVFAVVVLVLAASTWWLGEWQFGRLSDRKASNTTIATNEALPPAPVEEVMPVGGDVTASDQWRLVTATGTYDADQTVIVRYRSSDRGEPGIDVVVPLVTSSGEAVVVDRGFVATDADPASVSVSDLPLPPAGEVTIVGWARTNGTGDSIAVEDLSTRAISSEAIGRAWDRPVHGGFVDLRTETPPAATSTGSDALQQVTLPELDNGPHFFYGLQWWFFGLLALFGFGYLAYDERRRGPRGERRPSSRPVPLSARAAADTATDDAVTPYAGAGTVAQTVRHDSPVEPAGAAGAVETVAKPKRSRTTKAPRELTKSQAERLAASQERRRK